MTAASDGVPSPGGPFRELADLAWTYHRGTCRWTYNSSHPADDRPEAPEEHLDSPYHRLPAPAPLGNSLGGVLGERFSCRAFATDPISWDHVATLASTAYGTHGHTTLGRFPFPERPVPSGGGLYPLELYFLVRPGGEVPAGVHHYHPHTHGLAQLREVDLPARYVAYLFMNQRWFAEAAAVAVLTAVPHRSTRKYGDRGYRYLLLEGGHVAQNLVLAAGALGLGTCCGGGFFDDELAGLLCADVDNEMPIYAVAIGRPAALSRPELRRGEAGEGV